MHTRSPIERKRQSVETIADLCHDAVTPNFEPESRVGGLRVLEEQRHGRNAVRRMLVQTVDAFAAGVHSKAGQTLLWRRNLPSGQHTIELIKKSGAYMLLDNLVLQP